MTADAREVMRDMVALGKRIKELTDALAEAHTELDEARAELTDDQGERWENECTRAREQRDAAIAQLALARPIAEACANWVEYDGTCHLCRFRKGSISSDKPHAADCPVPAWIAGRL